MAITLSEYAAMGKLLTDRDWLLPSHRLPHLMSSSLHSTHTQDKSINFLKFHFLSSRYVHIKKAGEHFEGVKWRNLLSFSHHRRKAKMIASSGGSFSHAGHCAASGIYREHNWRRMEWFTAVELHSFMVIMDKTFFFSPLFFLEITLSIQKFSCFTKP